MRCLRTLSLTLVLAAAATGHTARFGTATVSEGFGKVAFDAAGNLYAFGDQDGNLLAASYKPTGVIRWSANTDGGFNQTDRALALVVQNNDLQLLYSSTSATQIESYGQQVVNKTTGAFGAQTTISPTPDTYVHGTSQLQAASTLVGVYQGLANAFIVRFPGSAPPTFTSFASNNPGFADVVQLPAGTFITGLDNLGGFLMKWDPVTSTIVWRSNLPVGFVPVKMAVGASGDLFIAGSIYVTSQDIGVVKMSTGGMPLGYGTVDAGAGLDDLITDVCMVGDCPVVVGAKQDLAGNRMLLSVFFQASITLPNIYSDPASSIGRTAVSDGTCIYLNGTDQLSGDDHLYKLSPTGLVWSRVLNQMPEREIVKHLGYRNNALVAVGETDGVRDAFIDMINPGTGILVW